MKNCNHTFSKRPEYEASDVRRVVHICLVPGCKAVKVTWETDKREVSVVADPDDAGDTTWRSRPND